MEAIYTQTKIDTIQNLITKYTKTLHRNTSSKTRSYIYRHILNIKISQKYKKNETSYLECQKLALTL